MMRISARSQAVNAVQEVCFKHRLQNACYRPLQQPWERKKANPAPKVWGWEPQISLEDGLACTYEWIEEEVREIA
jgi:nucleoside-diphosphate-sugar epimerase